MKQRMMIYLASPLFSLSEKMENDRLCRALERWCDVFLPQRDGELVPHLIQQGLSVQEAYRVVFERDVLALRACDAFVINLDGRIVDEGAAFELGYAHAMGKYCVGYRTDVRVLLPWGLNPMVIVPLSETFTCIEALETWARTFQLATAPQKPRLINSRDR
jgi:nucleoside 2-deoxyribosyltransferase